MGQLNYHLWFVPVFLAVTAILPFATKIEIPGRWPLWAFAAAFVLLIRLLGEVPFPVGGETIRSTLFYATWAVFGYHLAGNPDRYSARECGAIALVAVAILAGVDFSGSTPGAMNMQANKFPPNWLFALLSISWIGTFLAGRTLLRERSIAFAGLANRPWLSPFIFAGYSVYLWQGMGYMLASRFVGGRGLPTLFVWIVAVALSVAFGVLASPFERIKIRLKP